MMDDFSIFIKTLSSVLKRDKYYLRKTKIAILLTFLLGFVLWFWFCLPKTLFTYPTSYVIDDDHGQLLGALIAKDGQWRFPYDTNVPEKFRQCIIAFEDKRFEHHPGFDILALGRAIRQNIGGKHVISGGSTITMQVIRQSTKDKRNDWNKFTEIFKSMRLELRCSKKEILALYSS